VIKKRSPFSIFRYPGGKTKSSISYRILSFFPKEIDEYREPFIGGGGIFFSIDKFLGHFRKLKSKWINDLDTDLISVYEALQNDPNKFIQDCVQLTDKYSSIVDEEEKLKTIFDDLVNDKIVNQPLKYFFINRTVWNGRVDYTRPSRVYFSNPSGWNIVKTNKIKLASKCFENTKITNVDYSKLLLEDSIYKNVLIYCDPPYIKDTKLSKNSKLYRHSFSMEDHHKFADTVKKSNHKICISYDDDEEGIVRELFSDKNRFIIHSTEWSYCGTSSAKGQPDTKKIGKELIITNYE